MRPRLLHLLIGLFAGALVWPYPGKGQSTASATGEWRAYGGTELSTRYSPLDQLNRDTVKNLQLAWYSIVTDSTTFSPKFGTAPRLAAAC